MTSDSRSRVLIYGSCVSRDAFSRFDPARYTLLGYTARQSLISAGSTSVLDEKYLDRLPSRFQRRMLESDVNGNLLDFISRFADRTDLLLWDLTDERLGVYEMSDGTFITRSIELIASGADAAVQESARFIPFGTDEHFSLWSRSCESFWEELGRFGIRPRTVFLEVGWAEDDGKALPSPLSFGTSAKQANDLFARYFQFVSSLGFAVVRVPRDLLITNPDHQWGHAPFHFAEVTYEFIARQIAEIAPSGRRTDERHEQ